MLNFEELLRQGKTLEEIGTMVTDELNAAQLKLKEEEEKKKAEEAKKKAARAAAKMKKEHIRVAREAAVSALQKYFSLVFDEDISEDIIRSSLADIEVTFDYLKGFNKNSDTNAEDIVTLIRSFFK